MKGLITVAVVMFTKKDPASMPFIIACSSFEEKREAMGSDPMLFRILSTESLTKGCYASLPTHRSHLEQITHGSSLCHIPFQTLLHKLNTLRGHSRGRKRGQLPASSSLPYLFRRVSLIGVLSFRHFNHHDSHCPHITLQIALPVKHFRSHVTHSAAHSPSLCHCTRSVTDAEI